MTESKPIYIIAEAGVNHNGSPEMALELVRTAAAAGADAVKFQTFKADKMISRSAPKAKYQSLATGSTESQLEMVCKLELDQAAHWQLLDQCAMDSIHFLSTPFDEDSVDFLTNVLHLDKLKISSGDLTNARLLLKAAQTGKEIILSTGMSTLSEVEDALAVLAFGYTRPIERPSVNAFQQAYYSAAGQDTLERKVVLLHCSTEYPAPFTNVSLRAMDTLRSAFGLPIGYSDHTQGIAVSLAAAARGAVVIEKHFTLDRELPGPDHLASLEPADLKLMVDSIRQIELALGSSRKVPSAGEAENKPVARKSLVAAKSIHKGEIFTEENLTVKRPGEGISPMLYWELLGNPASQDYQPDEQVTEWITG